MLVATPNIGRQAGAEVEDFDTSLAFAWLAEVIGARLAPACFERLRLVGYQS